MLRCPFADETRCPLEDKDKVPGVTCAIFSTTTKMKLQGIQILLFCYSGTLPLADVSRICLLLTLLVIMNMPMMSVRVRN